jgi:hypothetical protein
VERQVLPKQKAQAAQILCLVVMQLPLLAVVLVVLVTGMFFLQEPLEVQVVQAAVQAALQVVTPLLVAQVLLGKVLLVAVVTQAETVVAVAELLPLVVLRLTMYPVVLAVRVLLQVSLVRQ